MATEYKLSYSASEIDERLGKIDALEAEIEKLSSQNAYELPVATAETLGGVMPVTATEDMTQPVGVDSDGKLYTVPGESGDFEVTPQWAEFPRATNPARDIYNAVSMANRKVLGADGTLRHNMMLEDGIITWMESIGNVDYADPSGAASVKLMGWRDRYGIGSKTENPNIEYTPVFDVFPSGSEILGVDGEVIDTIVATSDNTIVSLGSNNYLILSGCQGVSSYHMIYRAVNHQTWGAPTFGETIHALKINGAEWDMTTLQEDYHNKWSQINTKVVKNDNYYYMAVVQSGVGVAIMQSADGMDWSLANHIDDPDAYAEACIGVVSWVSKNMPTAYVVVRHNYGDGYISLYGLAGITGAVMTKTLIPASTGRPMLASWMNRDLYLTYSVNGRKNAVLAQILPNSDGTTGVSILETPREVMSNYPVLDVEQSSIGARWIFFGGTDGLSTKGSSISVAYLWNETDVLTEKNELLKKVLFGKSYTLPTATSETLGGVMPAAATDEMTQEVGVDADGKLFTKPSDTITSDEIANAVNDYMEANPATVETWRLLETKTVAEGDSSVTITFDAPPKKVILSGSITAEATANLRVVGNYTGWDAAYNRVTQIKNSIYPNISKKFILELEKLADYRWLVSSTQSEEGWDGVNMMRSQIEIRAVQDLQYLTLLSATDGQTFTGGTIEVYVQ